MRFLILLALTIVLFKFLVPEIAAPVVEIIGNLLKMASALLEHLLETLPRVA